MGERWGESFRDARILRETAVGTGVFDRIFCGKRQFVIERTCIGICVVLFEIYVDSEPKGNYDTIPRWSTIDFVFSFVLILWFLYLEEFHEKDRR